MDCNGISGSNVASHLLGISNFMLLLGIWLSYKMCLMMSRYQRLYEGYHSISHSVGWGPPIWAQKSKGHFQCNPMHVSEVNSIVANWAYSHVSTVCGRFQALIYFRHNNRTEWAGRTRASWFHAILSHPKYSFCLSPAPTRPDHTSADDLVKMIRSVQQGCSPLDGRRKEEWHICLWSVSSILLSPRRV